MNHYCTLTSFPPMLVHGVHYNGHQHVLVIFRKINQKGVLNNNIFTANGIQFDSDTVSIDKRRRMNACVCLFPKTRHSHIALTRHMNFPHAAVFGLPDTIPSYLCCAQTLHIPPCHNYFQCCAGPDFLHESSFMLYSFFFYAGTVPGLQTIPTTHTSCQNLSYQNTS